MLIKNGKNLEATFYEVEEIETHFHAIERWFGIHGAPTATRWGTVSTLGPYNILSGNNTWGAFASILGSADTPILSGKTKFDPHQIMVTGVSEDTKYRVRLIWGSATTTALAAGNWSETIIKFDKLNPQQSAGIPFDFRAPNLPSGTKVWAQTWNAVNLATLSIMVGVHEYDR